MSDENRDSFAEHTQALSPRPFSKRVPTVCIFVRVPNGFGSHHGPVSSFRKRARAAK